MRIIHGPAPHKDYKSSITKSYICGIQNFLQNRILKGENNWSGLRGARKDLINRISTVEIA